MIELLRWVAIAELALADLDSPAPEPRELEWWARQCRLLVEAA
jgi:hypothetical protein